MLQNTFLCMMDKSILRRLIKKFGYITQISQKCFDVFYEINSQNAVKKVQQKTTFLELLTEKTL